jgi:hypothetical protein
MQYSHQTVQLDGQAFSHCEFDVCRLVYAGGEAPSFDSCRFDNCEWRFEGAAAETLSCLKVMWSAGAKPSVQSIIKDLTAAAR